MNHYHAIPNAHDDAVMVQGQSGWLRISYDGSYYLITRPAKFPWLDDTELACARNANDAMTVAYTLLD